MLFNKFSFQALNTRLNEYFNSVYRKNYWTLRHIKSEIISSIDVCVLISFIFFVCVQSATLPIYSALFFYMLLNHSYRLYRYIYNHQQTEITSGDDFRHFNYAWLQFIYNITYRRASINSFNVIYKTLKLLKNCSYSKRKTSTRIITSIKTLLYFLLIFMWNLILGVPWFIVYRSFQYSRAFRLWRWSSRHRAPLRCRVINNYQLSELDPGIYFRIFKKNHSNWNFNPHYSKKNII